MDLDNLINNTLEEFLLECVSDKIEDAFVENYFVLGNEIHIQYQVAFILQTFINSEFIWRVQGCAQLELSIPDTNSVDWSVFDTQKNKFLEQYKKYKELVHFKNVVYKTKVLMN